MQPASRSSTSEGNEVIMATALGGTMLLTDQLLPILRKSQRPRIINVSSGGAYTVHARKDDLNTQQMTKYDGTLIYVRSAFFPCRLMIMTSLLLLGDRKTESNRAN